MYRLNLVLLMLPTPVRSMVNENGLQADPDKVESILGYPVPCSIEKLRRFLGLASWYRKFILNFASLASLLTRLLKMRKLGFGMQNNNQLLKRSSFAYLTPPFYLALILRPLLFCKPTRVIPV